MKLSSVVVFYNPSKENIDNIKNFEKSVDVVYVVDNSEYVTIDKKKITKFVNDLGEINYAHWSTELDLDLNEKEWILLACIIESMNFCFWKKPKWIIEYNNDLNNF